MIVEYPPHGQKVVVKCIGFLCLGMYMGEHQWRGAFKHEELPDVVAWCSLHGDKWHSIEDREPKQRAPIPN